MYLYSCTFGRASTCGPWVEGMEEWLGGVFGWTASEAVSYRMMESVCVGRFHLSEFLTASGDPLGEVHAG